MLPDSSWSDSPEGTGFCCGKNKLNWLFLGQFSIIGSQNLLCITLLESQERILCNKTFHGNIPLCISKYPLQNLYCISSIFAAEQPKPIGCKTFQREIRSTSICSSKNTERINCVSCLHCILHLFCSTFICILLKSNLRLQTQYTIRFIFRYLKNHVKLKIKQSLYNSIEW